MEYLKLYEDYDNTVYVNLFCEKVLNLFKEVLKSNHTIDYNNYTKFSIDVDDNYVVKLDTYTIFDSKSSKEKDTISFNYIIMDNDNNNEYPLLIEYILDASSLPYYKSKSFHYFDIFKEDINYKLVTKIKFSKEDYEIFVESERFGL